MKIIKWIILVTTLQGCTVAEVNDQLFAYYRDYDRQPEAGDATIHVESTQTQKALWVASDVYLDVYESCATRKKEEGYLGAAKVSSNEKVGLNTTISVPSNTPLYFSFGQYHPNASCGMNFRMALEARKEYKFQYNFPGKGCNVRIYEKNTKDGEYMPSSNIEFGDSGDAFTMYRKADWRRCRDWDVVSEENNVTAETKVPDRKAGYALLYVYREYAEPTLFATKISIDGERLAKLKQKSFTWIYVKTGERIVVSSWGGMAGRKAAKFKYNFEDGAVYTYGIKGAATIWTSEGIPKHFKNFSNNQDISLLKHIKALENCCKYIEHGGNS